MARCNTKCITVHLHLTRINGDTLPNWIGWVSASQADLVSTQPTVQECIDGVVKDSRKRADA